jgi:hypothetical protein
MLLVGEGKERNLSDGVTIVDDPTFVWATSMFTRSTRPSCTKHGYTITTSKERLNTIRKHYWIGDFDCGKKVRGEIMWEFVQGSLTAKTFFLSLAPFRQDKLGDTDMNRLIPTSIAFSGEYGALGSDKVDTQVERVPISVFGIGRDERSSESLVRIAIACMGSLDFISSCFIP